MNLHPFYICMGDDELPKRDSVSFVCLKTFSVMKSKRFVLRKARS